MKLNFKFNIIKISIFYLAIQLLCIQNIQLYILLYLVINMKKFKIPSIPPTTNKCIRFPNDVIQEVEEIINGTTCTFTAFVIEAVKVAIENVKESNEE